MRIRYKLVVNATVAACFAMLLVAGQAEHLPGGEADRQGWHVAPWRDGDPIPNP